MPSSGRKRKISQTPNENRNSNKKNSLDLVEMVKDNPTCNEKVENIENIRNQAEDVFCPENNFEVANLQEYKVFNDPIHGHIEVHPLCMKIIDTPQFQRLRDIKQLGGTYFVFPGGSHNRFEHCIGTGYLAGVLTRELQQKQPELNITDIDILCSEIAGLCHDLGHGPFSHCFDGKFIPVVRRDRNWKHEDASIDMLNYMLEEEGLLKEFERYGVREIDRLLIKEMIAGPIFDVHTENRWRYKGRQPDKAFLYEIIANKRTGIDVDKWDYFARDSYQLGLKNNFDHMRYIKFVRVLNVDGMMQMCCRDKEVECLYDMFHTRHVLHMRAYQHKNKNVVEAMIAEAFLKADDHLVFLAKNGEKLKLSQTIDDMYAYTNVSDSVFYRILYSSEPSLADARAILEKIRRRQLYKCIGRTHAKHAHFISYDDVDDIKQELAKLAVFADDDDQQLCMLTDSERTKQACQSHPLTSDDFVIHFVRMDYGMGEKNPMDCVSFYMKNNPTKPFRVRKDQVSQLLPDTFSEQRITAYCKRTEQALIDLSKFAFVQWCRHRNFPEPKGAGLIEAEFTPIKSLPSSQCESQSNSQSKDYCSAQAKLQF